MLAGPSQEKRGQVTLLWISSSSIAAMVRERWEPNERSRRDPMKLRLKEGQQCGADKDTVNLNNEVYPTSGKSHAMTETPEPQVGRSGID